MGTQLSGTHQRPGKLYTGTILLIFVAALAIWAALYWYGVGTHRPLSDAQIVAYLHDDTDPEGISYALSNIQDRVKSGQGVDRWASEILRLGTHPAEKVRHHVARLMGEDASRADFHTALLNMLRYDSLLVRNTAALSLARFGDGAGREQIAAMLERSEVNAPRPGHVANVIAAGATVAHGTPIARLQSANTEFEVLSPAAGRVRTLFVRNGDIVSGGNRMAVIDPGPEQVSAALKALELIGSPQDLTTIAQIANNSDLPAAVREQAKTTDEKIRQRTLLNGPGR